MTTLPACPDIPARPAAYVRGQDAVGIDDAGNRYRRMLISEAQDRLGWPEPVIYADAEPSGSQFAALAEAIKAGRHDGVFATHSCQFGDDLAQIEAFDRLCREHGVLLRFQSHWNVTDTRALFDVVHKVREFTVTDEHLRLLRHGHVFWDEAEFGAPSIDAKRPYGNSNVYRDIAEILGVPESEWSDRQLSPSLDVKWRFLRLHVETAIALQIALFTGEFRTGRYVRDQKFDRQHWRRVEA
jgi:hypothetical protein